VPGIYHNEPGLSATGKPEPRCENSAEFRHPQNVIAWVPVMRRLAWVCVLAWGCRSNISPPPGPDAGTEPAVSPDASTEPAPEPGDGGTAVPTPEWAQRGRYDADTYRLYDENQAAGRLNARVFCVCETASEAGPGYEACLNESAPPVAPPIADCTRALLSNDPAVKLVFECLLAARITYLECIEPATCSELLVVATTCDIDRVVAEAVCPKVPYPVLASIDQYCYGDEPAPAWACADGELISEERRCDLRPDCADGSDEVGCPHPPIE
jgi:hypothetical protein